MNRTIGIYTVLGLSLAIGGCVSTGRLSTRSGRPEITIPSADWKRASVAIASYNLSKGRKLDIARPNEIVLYEAVPSHDGDEQITSKTVYSLTTCNDGLLIMSRRFLTNDLDEDDAGEEADQATLDAEQQELQQIAGVLLQQSPSDAENAHQH